MFKIISRAFLALMLMIAPIQVYSAAAPAGAPAKLTLLAQWGLSPRPHSFSDGASATQTVAVRRDSAQRDRDLQFEAQVREARRASIQEDLKLGDYVARPQSPAQVCNASQSQPHLAWHDQLVDDETDDVQASIMNSLQKSTPTDAETKEESAHAQSQPDHQFQPENVSQVLARHEHAIGNVSIDLYGEEGNPAEPGILRTMAALTQTQEATTETLGSQAHGFSNFQKALTTELKAGDTRLRTCENEIARGKKHLTQLSHKIKKEQDYIQQLIHAHTPEEALQILETMSVGYPDKAYGLKILVDRAQKIDKAEYDRRKAIQEEEEKKDRENAEAIRQTKFLIVEKQLETQEEQKKAEKANADAADLRKEGIKQQDKRAKRARKLRQFGAMIKATFDKEKAKRAQEYAARIKRNSWRFRNNAKRAVDRTKARKAAEERTQRAAAEERKREKDEFEAELKLLAQGQLTKDERRLLAEDKVEQRKNRILDIEHVLSQMIQAHVDQKCCKQHLTFAHLSKFWHEGKLSDDHYEIRLSALKSMLEDKQPDWPTLIYIQKAWCRGEISTEEYSNYRNMDYKSLSGEAYASYLISPGGRALQRIGNVASPAAPIVMNGAAALGSSWVVQQLPSAGTVATAVYAYFTK